MASAAAFAFVRDRDRDRTSRRESFFDWLNRMENLDPETSEFWQLAEQIDDETANAISFRWHAKNTQAAQDRVMRDYWTYVKVILRSAVAVLSCWCSRHSLTPNRLPTLRAKIWRWKTNGPSPFVFLRIIRSF